MNNPSERGLVLKQLVVKLLNKTCGFSGKGDQFSVLKSINVFNM
jgi:hypothetical protein